MQCFIGHLSLQTQIRSRLAMSYRPAGRSDYAGCVVREDVEGMGMVMLIDPNAFAITLFVVCTSEPGVWNWSRIGQHKAVMDWLQSCLCEHGIPCGVVTSSPVKGCAIRSRLVKMPE